MTYKQEIRLLESVEEDVTLQSETSYITSDFVRFKFIDGKNSAKVEVSVSSMYNALFIILNLYDENGISRVKLAGYNKQVNTEKLFYPVHNQFYPALRNLIENLEDLEKIENHDNI